MSRVRASNADKDRRNRNNIPGNRGPLAIQKMMMILKAKGVLFIVPDSRNASHVAIGVADALRRVGLIRDSDVTDMDLYLRKQLIPAPAAQITAALALQTKQTTNSEEVRLVTHG